MEEFTKNEQKISDKYTDIEQIRSDVESLGDWKDPTQRDNYLKVISKIASICYGYSLNDGGHASYGKVVKKAIADICSKKFPSQDEIFEYDELNPGMLDLDDEFYKCVTHVTTRQGLNVLQFEMQEIARKKFGIDVFDNGVTEEEAKKLIESSRQYLTPRLDKSNAPYYQVAKQALMNWNGLSDEEADKIITEQTFPQLEDQVHAKYSIRSATEAIMAGGFDGIEEEEYIDDQLFDLIYYGERSSALIDYIKKDAEFMNDEDIDQDVRSNMRKRYNDMIMDSLFDVHDDWVAKNEKKFYERDKKHQHMPSELIGWKEVKKDLLFVRPIYEALGIKVNEEELEQVYNGRVKEFFLSRGIKNTRDLSDAITQGLGYEPLSYCEEILTTIDDPNYVDEHIIPAIEQQGIGNIEEVRRNIVSQIISNPVPEDVERLSDEEKALVEQSLGKEVSTLTAQRDELRQKNSTVKRIMDLANRRNAIKKEISIEEQKKSENLQEFDD